MNQSIVSEISNSLLFRYRLNCRKYTGSGKGAVELPVSNKLPILSELDPKRGKPFAELRGAWSPDGLHFWIKVKGKKQSLWCRETQILDSDGLQIWIDTRDIHNLHRATRFCHWFVLLPTGGGDKQSSPIATMLKINRAKEHAPSINQMPVEIVSAVKPSGYTMSVFLPSGAINGWNPVDHNVIGFNYVVADRELGIQTVGVGLEYPVSEDPSLWNSLVLER